MDNNNSNDEGTSRPTLDELREYVYRIKPVPVTMAESREEARAQFAVSLLEILYWALSNAEKDYGLSSIGRKWVFDTVKNFAIRNVSLMEAMEARREGRVVLKATL